MKFEVFTCPKQVPVRDVALLGFVERAAESESLRWQTDQTFPCRGDELAGNTAAGSEPWPRIGGRES